MSENFLRLSVFDDGDGTAKLTAQIAADGFAAVGSAWFNQEGLVAFAQSLGTLPLSEEAKVGISGGFYSRARPPVLEQTHLALRAYPVDSRGQVAVFVVAASERSASAAHESPNHAEIELLTSYEALRQFSFEFLRLARELSGEAVLRGETLG